MKRVGIITHYYKSTNFGGNLQAYALCEELNNLGYSAKQISFEYGKILTKKSRKTNLRQRIKGKSLFDICVKIKSKVISKFYSDEKNHKVSSRRLIAFENFNKNIIPHSTKIYDDTNISECINDYDIFITGSDQVWNFSWYRKEFFLDFVPSNKIKLSYAASIAKSSLTNEQKEIFRNSLKDFTAVSVREKSAVKLIEDLSPVPVHTVLDPTLLLTRADWDKVCSDRVVEDKYLFCYFLGESKQSRKLAVEFAKRKGLTLVTVPHAGGWIKPVDRKFGDIKLFDASPENFISLIKHAEYVFTDSFHAVVFSNIYKKQYYIFKRDAADTMSSRIVDITALFGTQERFCHDASRANMDYIEALTDIDYTRDNQGFEELREASIDFLKCNLETSNN